ncbi:hypothetical protein ACIGNX_09960 [Actinosynnema sp. NPDC053489]|uniref:hypothetical protein n=1 Tax=Actinosynnema sp. NPDC053489 TaxID=3363916 RepID=UPI0037C752C7
MTDPALPALTAAELLFEDVVDEHLARGLVERTWLLDRIEGHFADPGCRFVLLLGGPGTGKSTVMAWLARRYGVSPRYFLNRLDGGPLASGDAKSLLLRLGNQLAALRPRVMGADVDVRVEQSFGEVHGRAVGARVDVWRVSPFRHTALRVAQRADVVAGDVVGVEVGLVVSETRSLPVPDLQEFALLEPARRLAQDEPDALVVVLVDALDELRFRATGAEGADVLDWLAEAPELPANVRVVASARPDDRLLERFRRGQGDRVREVAIEAAAEDVRRDLVQLARGLLTDPPVARLPVVRASGVAWLARRIAAQADGNFLYLALWGAALRDAAEAGDAARVAALADFAVLPAGLEGFYGYFLTLVLRTVEKREAPAGLRFWDEVCRPLLDVLAVARAPLPRAALLDLARLAGRKREAARALDHLGQLLTRDDAGLRLCHLSFAEFLISAEDHPMVDHWHVDADENHYLIAERLIDRWGADWAACDDDYALDHTVAHLVSGIRLAGSPELRADCARALTALLAAPDHGLAKARRRGLDAVLADYVDAWAALEGGSTPAGSAIAGGLSGVVSRLVDEGVPDLAGTLHAVLGYRPAAAGLNREVLTRLTDPEYLADAVADEQRRSVALLEFSHGQATRLRRTGRPADLEEARRLLVEAVAAVEDLDRVTSTRQRAVLCYELGYLEFLHGEPARAAEWFTRSVDAAEEAGDRVGAAFTRLVAMRVGLLGGTVAPEEYRAAHEEALALFTGGEVTSPHLTRWTTSAHAQLLDLALFTEDRDEVAERLATLAEDQWYADSGRPELLDRYRARAAAVTGDWETAAELFGRLPADELGDPPAHREELARDLFYYGRALAALGDEDGARRVWELALRCPDNAANWPWKPRVREVLRGLG